MPLGCLRRRVRSTLLAAVLLIASGLPAAAQLLRDDVERLPWQDDPPIIISLDGMDLLNTIVGGNFAEKTTEYLADALEKQWQYDACAGDLASCPIQRLFWDGNMNQQDQHIADVKDVILEARRTQPDRPLVILAHSWGTVVAYLALEELEASGDLPPDAIPIVVTMGSPIGTQCPETLARWMDLIAPQARGRELIGAAGLAKPRSVSTWVNYWIRADRISGEIDFADNRRVRDRLGQIDSCKAFGKGGIATALAHATYYEDELQKPTDAITRGLGRCVQRLHAATNRKVPSRFGVPHNVFSKEKELIVHVRCDSPGAVLHVGSGRANQAIFHEALLWRDGAWQEIELEGERKVDGKWFERSASANLGLGEGDLGAENSVVAFVCTKVDATWKCGCRDKTCARSRWQLQQFER